MEVQNKRKNEQGFASGFVLLFIVTLALMAVGGAILMKSEGKRIGSGMVALQTDYSAQSAMWLAIQATAVDTDTLQALMDMVAFSIGGASITKIDTFIATSGRNALEVVAELNNCTRRITAEIEKLPGVLAIETTSSVNQVTVRDQNNNVNSELIDENRASLRVIDNANLQAIAVAQGQDTTSFSPPDGWPAWSYYNAPGVPNVTNINGNLTVNDNFDVYGIFVVNGNVTIGNGAKVHGIIYAINGGNTVRLNGPYNHNSVEGGIISEGPIEGKCGFFNLFNSRVLYKPAFIRGFMESGLMNVPDRVETQNYSYN